MGVLQRQQVLGLEVIAETAGRGAVVVVVEGNDGDRVGEAGEPGAGARVDELAAAGVAVEQGRTEARHHQVLPPVVVGVEPERVGDDRARVVAAAYPSLDGDVAETRHAVGTGAVVVQQMVALPGVGIGEEEVVATVSVVVADGDHGAAGGEHAQHVAVRAAELAGVVPQARAGRGAAEEAQGRGAGGSRRRRGGRAYGRALRRWRRCRLAKGGARAEQQDGEARRRRPASRASPTARDVGVHPLAGAKAQSMTSFRSRPARRGERPARFAGKRSTASCQVPRAFSSWPSFQ